MQKAIQTMYSVGMAIEERLRNCEKVLRLLLQVSISTINSSRGEQKELSIYIFFRLWWLTARNKCMFHLIHGGYLNE